MSNCQATDASGFEKQPYEEFWVSVSFKKELVKRPGEQLLTASCTVVAKDARDNDVSAAIVTPGSIITDGPWLRAHIKGGDDINSPYKLTFRAWTNATPASKWEKDIRMRVKER